MFSPVILMTGFVIPCSTRNPDFVIASAARQSQKHLFPQPTRYESLATSDETTPLPLRSSVDYLSSLQTRWMTSSSSLLRPPDTLSKRTPPPANSRHQDCLLLPAPIRGLQPSGNNPADTRPSCLSPEPPGSILWRP